jgi:hypothetical protein
MRPASLSPPAIVLVDAGVAQDVGGLRAQHQMVDPKAGVALPTTGGIIRKA